MSLNSDDWSTRHSVLTTARRTAALVNALADDRPAPADVADVLRAYGETDPIGITTHDIAGMRAAAALLRQVYGTRVRGTVRRGLGQVGYGVRGRCGGRARRTSRRGRSRP
ncbi:hypothetical protein SGRIM128S_01938 [Streptomyces griseomycini]